jgi:hypothetical protein
VCRFHVATGWRRATKLSLTAPLLEHHAVSGHHLQSFVCLLLDWLPWFHNWGKTCCYIHQNLLLGFSNWPVILLHQLGPIIYQLPNCNLFTQHVLFILWRDTTGELWIPVQFPLYCYHLYTLLALFTFSHITIDFHSIHSYLCLQQTGEIDNLIVSWEQSTWLCCVQVPRCY